MKLKIFRVKEIDYSFNPRYRFVLGVEKRAVANREGVPLEDVLEFDNEVLFNVVINVDIKQR